MSRRTRWVIAALAAVAVAVVGIVMAWPSAERRVKDLLTATLSGATGLPATTDGFSVSLTPLRLRAASLVIGDPATPAVRATGIEVVFDLRQSWFGRRPVLHATIGQLDVDASRLPPASAGQGSATPAPLAWVPAGALEIEATHVSAPVEGESLVATAGPLRIELTPGVESIAVMAGGAAVELARADQSLRVDDWHVEGDVGRGGPLLRGLALHSDVVTLRLDATGTSTLAVQADADIQRAWAALRESGSAAGSLQIRGTLRPDLHRPDFRGTVAIESPAYNDLRAARLSGDVLFDGRFATVRQATAEFPGATIGGDAYVAVEAPYAFGLWLSVPANDIRALLTVAGGGPPIAGRAEGRVELQGSLAPWSADGYATATGRELRPADSDAKGVAVDVDARLDMAATGSVVEARAQAGSAATATVNARASAEQALSGDLRIEIGDAGVLRALGADVRGGSATARATLSGTLADPRLAGDVDARNVIVAGSRVDAVKGGFTATNTRLSAAGLEVQAVGGRARVDGDFAVGPGETNSWRVMLQQLDLESAWLALRSVGVNLPYVAGKLSGDASASGAWSALRLDARLSAAPLTVTTERVTSATAEVHSDGTSWRGKAGLTRSPDESAALEGSGTWGGTMAVTLRSTPWSLTGFHFIPADAKPLEGTASVSAKIGGTLARPQGEVELVLNDTVLRGYSIGEVRAHGESAPGGWRVRLDAPLSNLSAEGEIRDARGFPFTLAAQLRDSEFTAEAHEQPLQLAVAGSLSASGALAEPGAISGRLELQRFDVARGAHRWDVSRPIVVRGTRGRFTIESAELFGEFGSMRAEGEIGLDGSADLQVTADTDAEALELMGPPFTSARGAVHVRAHIAHPRAQAWNLRGRAEMDAVALDIGLPFVLSDVNGAFDLTGSKIVLEDVHGHAGGGEFSLTGAIDLASGPQLHFTATEISSGFVDWIEDRASGTGAIQGTWDDLEVVAEVQVLNALYDRPVAIADLLPWFREQVTPRVHPPKEKAIRLDLRIRANDSLYIDTNYAKAELRGGFRITGTDIKPVVKGRIEVIDGEVEVLDRRFTVTDGEVAFGGGEEINPTLNFTAISSVSTTDTEYQVTAQVLGTLRDYRVLLFADDPSMTTTDVAMLLATGKSPAERQREGTLSTGGMVQLAPALYGDTLRKGVTHYIPVDRFEIEPVYSRSTGNIEPRLTIGKDLTSDLRALVSGTFGVERRNTASLEYRLTPSIVLQGSWESQTTDQAGGFGGDIKFRHEFRHLPFSLWRSIDAEKR